MEANSEFSSKPSKALSSIGTIQQQSPTRALLTEITTMLQTIIRRAAQEATEFAARPTAPTHPLKKVWPPDFTQLSPQAQLRFEKKYKRRLALKYARPGWDKGVRIAQLVTFTVLGAGLFFTEVEFFGKKYRFSEQLWNKAIGLWGAVDRDTRYERRQDVTVSPPKE